MVGLLPPLAHANPPLDQPLSEGFALDLFEPAPAGDRFFLVPDASVPQASPPVRGMLFAHYATQPSFVLEDPDTGEPVALVDTQLYLHLNGSVYAGDWLALNLDVPFAAVQDGERAVAPEGGQLGDLRLAARASLVGDPTSGFAFGPQVALWAPTGSEENLTGEGMFRVQPGVIASGRLGAFIYALDGGFQFRKSFDGDSIENGNLLAFGAAAGLSLFDDVLQIGPELSGGLLASQDNNDLSADRTTPLQALFGARVRLGSVIIGAAYAAGITDAPGVTDRLVASLAFSPRADASADAELSGAATDDDDNDGIPDPDDVCPNKAGVASVEPTRHGCPPTGRQDSVDSDGDEIPDSQDACPELLGDPDDDWEVHGCPKRAFADSDNDQVPDAEDACPDQAGSAAAPRGCPEDQDSDGIPDSEDRCPRQAGAATADPSTHGCLRSDKATGAQTPLVTFVGYQEPKKGVSRLFVELTDEVPIDAETTGRTLTYRFRGAHVTYRNNRNPLVTHYFGSAIKSARLRADKAGAVLIVELNRPVEAKHKLVRRPHGATLQIDLPSR